MRIAAAVPGTPAIDASPGVGNFATRRGHASDGHSFRVHHINRHRRDGVFGCNQAALDRKGANARQHVSAGWSHIDQRTIHRNLSKKIIDINSGPRRSGYDGNFAGQRICTADAVDLSGIGRAHGSQQYSIACRDIGRQIAGQKERSLRRAAAHQRTRDGGLQGLQHCGKSFQMYFSPRSATFFRKP